jgi:peptide/nickel transport system substrate-binding protein
MLLPAASLHSALSILLLSLAPAEAAPFRYAEDQAPAVVNPLFTTSMSEARLNELVFEGLFTDNKDLATTPELAEGAEINADRTEQIVHLRQDVVWHDGKPFVADDVVFTIQAMQSVGTASTEAGRVDWIKKAEAIDSHTVKLTFTRPEARPEDKLFFKILPKGRFASTTVKRTDPFRQSPIGTGPYKVSKFNDDGSVTMSRFDAWHDKTTLQEVVMREVSDKNYQAKLLLYESLEALVRVLPRDLAVLKADRKVELYPYQTNSWWYLGFNMGRDPWKDPAVRGAVARLIDVQSLLDPVGTGDILSGPYVPSSPYYNHDVAPYRRDPVKAAELLTTAGYTQVGGKWTKGGKALSLRISAHKSLESSQEVVINLQSQLQSSGLDVTVDFLDDAIWKSQIWRDRDYDVVLSQWSFDRNEDVREQLHSKGTRNFTGYNNPNVDALLDRARDALEPQQKKGALRELHRVVHDDSPMVFLWTLDSYSAMSVRVRNVVIHPFYFFTWIKDWQTR